MSQGKFCFNQSGALSRCGLWRVISMESVYARSSDLISRGLRSRLLEVVGATIVSLSRTPVLSYDHFFQAPATQAIYSRNLYTDVVLFFFSLSSKTSVSAESEKEKWRTSVNIFGKKEVYFKVPPPNQRLIIIPYAFAVPIRLNQWYWRYQLLSILEHFKNDTRTRVFV